MLHFKMIDGIKPRLAVLSSLTAILTVRCDIKYLDIDDEEFLVNVPTDQRKFTVLI